MDIKDRMTTQSTNDIDYTDANPDDGEFNGSEQKLTNSSPSPQNTSGRLDMARNIRNDACESPVFPNMVRFGGIV